MESSPFSASIKPNLPRAGSWSWTGSRTCISARAGHAWRASRETFECVWCTGWEDRADEHLPRLLGLPGGWAHLTFAAGAAAGGLHWKLAAIEAHAGPDRAVAWIDDAHDDSCERWAAERPGADAAGRHRPGGRHHRRARGDAAQLGARSVRMTTSGGRSSRTGIPLVPTPEET